MNYMLIMKDARSDLHAVGPVDIEYEAAMLRDEIEEHSDWTAVGIARVHSERQVRAMLGLADPGDVPDPADLGHG
jgi:hypothetical protein